MADDIRLINELYGHPSRYSPPDDENVPARGIPRSPDVQVGQAHSNVGPIQPPRLGSAEADASIDPYDKELIVAALLAVMPYGGGSPQFHLANRLAQLWDIDTGDDAFQKLTGRLSKTSFEEYVGDDDLDAVEELLSASGRFPK